MGQAVGDSAIILQNLFFRVAYNGLRSKQQFLYHVHVVVLPFTLTQQLHLKTNESWLNSSAWTFFFIWSKVEKLYGKSNEEWQGQVTVFVKDVTEVCLRTLKDMWEEYFSIHCEWLLMTANHFSVMLFQVHLSVSSYSSSFASFSMFPLVFLKNQFSTVFSTKFVDLYVKSNSTCISFNFVTRVNIPWVLLSLEFQTRRHSNHSLPFYPFEIWSLSLVRFLFFWIALIKINVYLFADFASFFDPFRNFLKIWKYARYQQIISSNQFFFNSVICPCRFHFFFALFEEHCFACWMIAILLNASTVFFWTNGWNLDCEIQPDYFGWCCNVVGVWF